VNECKLLPAARYSCGSGDVTMEAGGAVPRFRHGLSYRCVAAKVENEIKF